MSAALVEREQPVAVKAERAARMLDMSESHFRREVAPKLRKVFSGQLVLYPVRELERWVEREAS